MEACTSYESYLKYLLKIVDILDTETNSQSSVAQDERNSVLEAEKKYQLISEELQSAKKAVQEQYRSVWESCTQSAGLRRPQDQRPAMTNLSWKDAVHLQEQAASKIRDWFRIKTQQAFVDRQKKLQEDESKKAALAAAQAEADRRNAEEAARAEKERSEALVEAMKRKHRGNS